MTERLIFHVDVNSAFLSWEAVRRVKNGETDLRLIPSCIGGDPESRRGIVLAKSIPAKQYQVKTGEPLSLALRKCPELVIASPDFKLYSACSKAFKDICRSYAPVVEEFSVDECFLDMSGTEYTYPDPIRLAYEIKDRIREELGFTVNVGIGRSKLCAKMASDFEKPDKVHTLFPEEIPEKMWPLPVGDLLFVGGTTAKRLREEEIFTIGELAQADPEKLRLVLGDKMSLQAHRYANGIDDSPVRAEAEETKGYSNSVTLEDDVTGYEQADAILLALAESVSSRLRSDETRAGLVSVTVRYLDFTTRSHQRRLDRPTDLTRAIYETAKQLLRELWNAKRPLRLLGISLGSLARGEDETQLSLFDKTEEPETERDVRLDRAVDALRSKFGKDIIRRGSVMNSGVRVSREFKGKQNAKE